ncbi:MAG: 6-pyruvoyltetrahydropterin/6-carboxytetrahydropterin synthase [Phormidesmis priestleyi Ana]|uniref:6-carboxy-5,6,7,8-tetrahydropterin synthase n=1 Tax=Phormidesmis priestleyi Ana TaxID=1666911 RepID=A0A0P7ZTR1_9CYAN|nr:MAG: 6-pyruvoyltetrahydropterin/6-carboxytetrahydropterin synthase [Phormidesmis priestleyi Ana]
MKCTINRRSQFCASHRYWLPELSESENLRLFGKCTRAPGHGHNYVLHAAITSELDAHGMVLNLTEAKAIIQREIIEPLDFSYLNDAWDEFAQTLPTTENIARVIWHRLVPHLPAPLRLTNIELYETPNLWASYPENRQGNGMNAYLTVAAHFSAAHRLALPELSYEQNCEIYGKCARPNGHGHNYRVEVTVKGDVHPRTGMLVDLVALQNVIDHHVIEPFDHTFLNKDVPYFVETVPTAENIVIRICQLLYQPIEDIGATLHKVKLIESPNNSAEVLAEELMDLKISQSRSLAAVI